ncbi:hypothetical protein BH11PSE11_BH11PSE11_04560 [soil metagenome]
MSTTIFVLGLVLPLFLTLTVMGYLRPILRNVLTEICGTEERGEFWIRCATILSLFGALILVLALGPRDQGVDMIASLRSVLVLTLVGGFVGVAWIARTIWKSLTACPETRARLFNTGTGIETASAIKS